MYLLTLAGLAPIQKVHRLEQMIPPENLKASAGDLRHGFVGELLGDASYSSEDYTADDPETSGRDTDFDRAEESSEEGDRTYSEKGEDNLLNSNEYSGDFHNASMSARRKRHHKSESMSRRRRKKSRPRRARSSAEPQNSEYDDEDEEDGDRTPGSPRGDDLLGAKPRGRQKRGSRTGSPKGSRSKRSGEGVSKERTGSADSNPEQVSALRMAYNSAEQNEQLAKSLFERALKLQKHIGKI